jgi:hypothetical protein
MSVVASPVFRATSVLSILATLCFLPGDLGCVLGGLFSILRANTVVLIERSAIKNRRRYFDFMGALQVGKSGLAAE